MPGATLQRPAVRRVVGDLAAVEGQAALVAGQLRRAPEAAAA